MTDYSISSKISTYQLLHKPNRFYLFYIKHYGFKFVFIVYLQGVLNSKIIKTSKFLSSLTTTFGTLLILLLISCERPGVDPLGPSTSKLRQAASNETDLPILEVIVEDYESKKSTIEKRPKHSKDFSTDDADPGECSGTEYLYVGGLSLQQALFTTGELLGQGNLCTVIWTGASDGALGISVTRTAPYGSNPETWDVAWVSNGSIAHWLMYGANTYGGNYTAPVLHDQGAGGDNMTALERQVFDSMNADQKLRYPYNYNTALDRLAILQERCGGGTNGDGTGNAFLHAYWAALNARSLGADLALRLVSAHEAHNVNFLSQASMDHFNDMLGIRITRDYPTLSDESIATVIENRIITGHGRMLAPGTAIYQRTTRSLCE